MASDATKSHSFSTIILNKNIQQTREEQINTTEKKKKKKRKKKKKKRKKGKKEKGYSLKHVDQ